MNQKYKPRLKMVKSPRAAKARTINQYLRLVLLGDEASMFTHYASREGGAATAYHASTDGHFRTNL
jgi:hypothetical protein